MTFAIKSLGTIGDALAAARDVSPYLERLCLRREATFEDCLSTPLSGLIASALAASESAGLQEYEQALASLRHAKADVHLSCAAGDLAGVLSLDDVTQSLATLADKATASALRLAARFAPPRDQACFNTAEEVPGLFLIGMGKHGAQELNYSSDIDLAAFYDKDAFAPDHQDQASSLCVRIVQSISRILEDVTPDGYVFRVDWRLRPDPASTPVAISMRAAEAYYESVGQNWERAAYIKARAIAGDFNAAASLLNHLQPFIWRKSLDFAAIDDIQSILRQIHTVRRSTDLDNPAFDVKLGRGGIREIEFFVQTQQLILGGRDRSLRGRRTLDCLDALVSAGRITDDVRSDLAQGYVFLRQVEHRIQMLDDEQTHKLPADDNKRARVAVLCGLADLGDLDRAIRQCREMVRARVRDLFPDSRPLSNESGSLVFTGVEDDPETLQTIAGLGYKAPEQIARTIRGWHHGHVTATRTARARELLTALTPDILSVIAATGEPDVGFVRFRDFFAALPAGVQVLSLFKAEPQILAETCSTLALAPRLGESLARRPAILDAMMSPRFSAPLARDEAGSRQDLLAQAVGTSEDFEESLDLVRRSHREEMFRIGFQVLHGRAKADEAGPAYTDLATATIQTLLPVAKRALEQAHGTLQGRVAICGWGKLGGNELAADSDLDVMIVYDVDDDLAESDGKRPLSGETWHARLTQRLVAALSAQTAEGTLYEVDMQLRPSGTAGPVAVRFTALDRYYRDEAWTWEYQALTRLRPIAGDGSLCDDIVALSETSLRRPRDRQKTINDVVAMRAKMASVHQVRGPWDIKRQSGGLIDLEFLAQTLQLIYAPEGMDVLRTGTLEAIDALGAAGLLETETAQRLIHAGRLLHDFRQVLAVASGPGFDPEHASSGLKAALAACVNAPDFACASAMAVDARALISSQWAKIAGKATE